MGRRFRVYYNTLWGEGDNGPYTLWGEGNNGPYTHAGEGRQRPLYSDVRKIAQQLCCISAILLKLTSLGCHTIDYRA
jgi:hypothetical protein